MLKLSNHSVHRLIGRLGIDPLQVAQFVSQASEKGRFLDYDEACKVAPLYSKQKGTLFLEVPDPKFEGKTALLVIRENTVITVFTGLTPYMYGVPDASMSGKPGIKLMGGETIEDKGNWVRLMRQERIRKVSNVRKK